MPSLFFDSLSGCRKGIRRKAGRDRLIKLHPVVIDDLRKLDGFDPRVFPWVHNRRTLAAVAFLHVPEVLRMQAQ